MTQFIPDALTANVDEAIIFFLTSLYNLDTLVNVSTILNCLQILVNFYIGVMLFWLLNWILGHLK